MYETNYCGGAWADELIVGYYVTACIGSASSAGEAMAEDAAVRAVFAAADAGLRSVESAV